MSGTIRGLDYGLVNGFCRDPAELADGPFVTILDPQGEEIHHSIYMEPAIRADPAKWRTALRALRTLAKNKMREAWQD